jgi:hypothetical protein
MKPEYLHFRWDLWAFHGIEPDEEAKKAVRDLQLSDAPEHMGETRQKLERGLTYGVTF